jgi:hypothetical protein
LCVAGSCVCNADAGSSLCGTTCVDTLTDPNNCGSCGHICQAMGASGVCAGGACQATVVAAPGAAIFDITVTSTDVWWTQPASLNSEGALLRKPFASGTSIATVEANLPDPRGITKDLNNIFWVDYATTAVNQLDLTGLGFAADWPPPPMDGSSPPVYDKPIHIATDGTNVYWVSNSTGDVLSLPIMNAGFAQSPTVLASGQDHPYAITIYGSNVFWANQGSSTNPPNGSVVQIAAGGGSPITLSSGESQPFDIAADANNVYWVDNANPGTVSQVRVGGGTVITLASGEGAPYGIAVDSKNVYWTSFSSLTVNAIPIGGGDGGAKTVYAAGQSGPAAIAVDDVNIYWVNQSSGQILEITK